MSTTPENAWADAGLVPPEDDEVPELPQITFPVDPEHRPAAPRPDLRDEAAESDVVDQALDVPQADEDYLDI